MPERVQDVAPEWISQALGARVEATPSVESLDFERVGVGYGLSSDLYRLRLRGRGSPRSVVVKLWRTDTAAGEREARFYGQFGDRAGTRVPRCYHASVDSERRRGALVLEDIEGAEQGDCLDVIPMGRAFALARALARFHRRWLEDEEVSRAEWLPSATVVWKGDEWLASRRSLFRERFEGRLDAGCRALVDAIEAVERRANEILSGFPETLLHADLHLDNVLFEANDDPVILDWARVARGPAVLDLGDLIFGMGRVREAGAILDAYAGEMGRIGAGSGEASGVRRGLTGALLRRFIASTLGIARWSPASTREERIIEQSLSRAQEAVLAWLGPDPAAAW